MEPIRVLEIIQGFAIEGPLGGIERCGIELVQAIDRTRVEPILCGLWRYHTPYEERRVARLREEGIDAFFAAGWDEAHPYRSFVEARRGTLQYLAGKRVDLIHSHCQFGDGVALLTARPLHAQALLRTVHNEREWIKRPARRLFLTNLLLPLIFRVEIGVSKRVADNLNRRPVARLLKRKGLCIYNALNLERFSTFPVPDVRERKRQELGLPVDAPVVGTIGRLTVQKGYSLLLEAAVRILAEMPSVRFLIIGEGELRDELQGMARQLGAAHAVEFTGARQDIEGLLLTMDLFASSSLWEGLPTVILEAMAARLPVVATDVSGTRELVEDGVTGLLVPPGDPHALAQAIMQVLREGEGTRERIEQAYRRVQDFSITEVARQHQDLYQSLLSPSNPIP